MSTDEGTYAPKSPDLSSFFGEPGAFAAAQARPPAPTSVPSGFVPQQQQAHHHQQQQQIQIPGPGAAVGMLPVGSSPATGYQQHFHTGTTPAQSYGQPQAQTHHTYSAEPYNSNFVSYTSPSPGAAAPLHLQHHHQPPFFPPQQAQDHYGHIPPQPTFAVPPPYYSATSAAPYTDTHQSTPGAGFHHPSQHHPTISDPGISSSSAAIPTTTMPPRKASAAAAQAAQQPEIMPSPVRTKFPTARIKRIMQADEEVGKVAQQTPIAVGKALELFMVQIVTKSADVAKEKNSKRISAQMLKQAVEGNPQWDFLQDIVAKVSEKEESKASKSKTETDSDDPDTEPKKKSRGGRKKKADS